MSKLHRMLSVMLAALLVLSGALAEEENDSEPSAKADPAIESTADAGPSSSRSNGADSADSSDETPTPEPTPTPTPEPDGTPTPEPDETPTPEPNGTPTPEPDETPTPEPDETPTPAPSETPTPEPTATLPALTVTAEPSEGVFAEENCLTVPAGQAATLTLTWSEPGDQDAFHLLVVDELDACLLDEIQCENTVLLQIGDLPDGGYLFTVEATTNGEAVASAQYPFTIRHMEGRPGGNRLGGGRSASSGSRGSQGAGGEDGDEAEQGFHITAGEALTDDHVSGNKDMALYGAMELSFSEASQTELLVEGRTVVRLDGGERTFTASVEGDRLLLVPEDAGDIWTVNGLALKALKKSGIATLALAAGSETVELATAPAYCGSVYGGLRAGGLVAGDCTYQVSKDGVCILAGDAAYAVDDSNAWVPIK